MLNQTILSVITVVNVFILGFSALNLLGRKHITNLLMAFSLFSLGVLEIGKFSLIMDFSAGENILGLGFSLLMLCWLIFSISLFPSQKRSRSRIIATSLLGLLSFVFFLIWWIKPFIAMGKPSSILLVRLTRYFFILFITNLSFSLSNLERSIYFLQLRRLKLLLASAILFLIPYILLATYAILFAIIKNDILLHSSLSVLAGGIIFLFASQRGFSTENLKEETAIHTSLTLFLIGGYLFFLGAFIKLFQYLGGNLHTLFSFLTAIFIFFAFLFLIFSPAFKERLNTFLLKYISRQKYDWQRIWEEFTYKTSLLTEPREIKRTIKEAVERIMNIKNVEIFLFDKEIPFEEDFADWLLRQADCFRCQDVFDDGESTRYPKACQFFKKRGVDVATPLYGERKVIGLLMFPQKKRNLDFFDKELLKVLSLQASSVILNARSHQKLREAEKKASLYKVSSFIIHDLKNFINNLSLLIANKDKFDNPRFREDAIFTLENTIDKMRTLVEEFKTLRGDLQINKKICNLKDIVEDVLKDIGRERFRNIELMKNLNGDIFLEADAHSLYKVVFNLIINSLEAMGGGGKLFIRTGIFNNLAVIFIKDTGCGMSKEFINKHLFKPFHSTKSKGLGIGLYQCKEIITAHKGKIEVESKEGEGTVFKVKLPAAQRYEALRVTSNA